MFRIRKASGVRLHSVNVAIAVAASPVIVPRLFALPFVEAQVHYEYTVVTKLDAPTPVKFQQTFLNSGTIGFTTACR